MFPDPSIHWLPYASIIDGIERPPFVLDQGFWRGILHLIVMGPAPSERFYGIEIGCEIYGGFEEMIYSVANHGDRSSFYDGSTYIKKARQSRLISEYENLGLGLQPPRQFLFVGGDYCYETLGSSDPVIRQFNS